jgi:hypothetical protein
LRWARRAGKRDAWISERTGHESTGDMINRYDRGAQTLADLDYEPFPNIAHAIPELPPLPQRLPQSPDSTRAAVSQTAAIPAAFL